MKSADVIIIGAGLGGLCLGALLADEGGRSVLLLEKSAVPGGRVMVIERDGFRLDWGIHAMLHGNGGTIARVVRSAGGRLRVHPAGMCIASGGKFEPLAAESLLLQLAVRPPIDFSDAGRIVSRVVRGGRGEISRVAGMSLAELADEVRAGERLTRALKAVGIGLFAVDDINDASAMEFFVYLAKVLTRGSAIGYPFGGWREVIRALLCPIETNKQVELRLASNVERIKVKEGRAAGVRLADGESISAETVVWAAPVQRLPDALPEGALAEEDEKKMRGLRATYGVCIDFAIERPVCKERRCMVTLDPPTLGWFVSNLDPAVAPRGRQLLTIFSPVSPERWPDREFRDARRTVMREIYIRMFPEIEGNIMWERSLETLVTSARADTSQASRLKPGAKTNGIENLLLVGDGTSAPGLGGEAAAVSALTAFDIIMEKR